MKLLSFVLVLLGLAAVASAYQVQRDPCAWGPTYWCKSSSNAQRCRQVHYCRENFWKASMKMNAPVGDTECDTCTKVVDEIGKVVNNSMTEEAAKELAKEACDLLGPIAPECKLLIDGFFDDIWKLLDKELTPQEICEQLKLCSKDLTKVFATTLKSPFGLECSLCKSLIGEVVKKLINTSEAQDRIKSMIEEVCNALPSGTDQEECKTFIDSFFPTIWKLFIDDLLTPDKVCDLLGVCGNKTVSRQRAPLVFSRMFVKGSQDPLCDLCKELDTVLKAFMDGANETQLKEELKDFCREIPEVTTECTNLVDNYFDLVWTILKTYVDDPDQFCGTIGLCNSTAKAAVSTKVASSGVECEVCKTLVKVANVFLTRNSTQEEVLSILEKGCGLLPSEYSDECTAFVKQYGLSLYNLVLRELDPDSICSELKACATSVLKSGAVCEVCEEALGLVKSLLPTATDTVVSVLTEVCELMPSALQDECTRFVKQYGPELIPLIAGLIDPDKDCQMVGLCSQMGVFKMRRSL